MRDKRRSSPILPYDLRVKIWDMIHRNKTTENILNKLFCDLPPNVSEDQCRRCILAIRASHTKGNRPNNKKG
jgi:hypothetical protein